MIRKFIEMLKRSEDISSLKECERCIIHIISSCELKESEIDDLQICAVVIDKILTRYEKSKDNRQG